MPLFKRATAEFFGTFWLVFGGCGSAVLAAAFPGLGIGFVGVAFAFGLTVLTMAYAIGPVSGGHRGGGCPLRNREREGGVHASRRIRVQWIWGTLTGWLFTSRLPGGRSGPHHVLPVHYYGLHRTTDAQRLCSHRDWARPHPHSPYFHSGHQHLGEPRA